jgi:hypothetical protein
MKFRTSALMLAPALLLVACGGGKPATEAQPPDVALTDANNYTSVSHLDIPKVATKAGADLNVCWDGITKDILCHDIATGNTIDNVAFLQIPNTNEAAASDKLAKGQLDPNIVMVYGDYHTAGASSKCVNLSQLKLGGKLIAPATDYVVASNKIYMMLFATGTTPGIGARSMLFLEPSDTSTNTTVMAPDGCSSNILDFNATLGQAINISATDSTKWKVGWGDITKDSFGNTIPTTHLKRVLLGFYQGMTVQNLQDNFLDIQQIATALYEVPVVAGDKFVDLADAKIQGGTTAFPGFAQAGTGTWMVAVMCDDCQLPAPPILSVLNPQ